jgi:hypothetical protein
MSLWLLIPLVIALAVCVVGFLVIRNLWTGGRK